MDRSYWPCSEIHFIMKGPCVLIPFAVSLSPVKNVANATQVLKIEKQ
jgi:hypothetical protein